MSIMLKLIEAKRFGDRKYNRHQGTVEEFKEWFLRERKAKNWTTAISHSRVVECKY